MCFFDEPVLKSLWKDQIDIVINEKSDFVHSIKPFIKRMYYGIIAAKSCT